MVTDLGQNLGGISLKSFKSVMVSGRDYAKSLRQNDQKKLILQAFYGKNPADAGKCHTCCGLSLKHLTKQFCSHLLGTSFIIANSALCTSLAIYHLISNLHS